MVNNFLNGAGSVIVCFLIVCMCLMSWKNFAFCPETLKCLLSRCYRGPEFSSNIRVVHCVGGVSTMPRMVVSNNFLLLCGGGFTVP